MCGFLGKVSTSRLDSQLVEKCNNFMKCRGPDETKFIEGKINEIFSSKNEKYISFYFNRLAILDLTPKASQPMVSKRFNTTVMFNGEIFNHKELRETLENEGVKVLISSENAVCKSENKAELYKTLENSDVKIPNYRLVNTLKEFSNPAMPLGLNIIDV